MTKRARGRSEKAQNSHATPISSQGALSGIPPENIELCLYMLASECDPDRFPPLVSPPEQSRLVSMALGQLEQRWVEEGSLDEGGVAGRLASVLVEK